MASSHGRAAPLKYFHAKKAPMTFTKQYSGSMGGELVGNWTMMQEECDRETSDHEGHARRRGGGAA